MKCGLSVNSIDIKNDSKDPSLEYKYQPSTKTRKELIENMKKKNVNYT